MLFLFFLNKLLKIDFKVKIYFTQYILLNKNHNFGIFIYIRKEKFNYKLCFLIRNKKIYFKTNSINLILVKLII